MLMNARSGMEEKNVCSGSEKSMVAALPEGNSEDQFAEVKPQCLAQILQSNVVKMRALRIVAELVMPMKPDLHRLGT